MAAVKKRCFLRFLYFTDYEEYGSFHTDRVNMMNGPHTHTHFVQITVYILRVWKCTGMKVHGYKKDRAWKWTGMKRPDTVYCYLLNSNFAIS